MRIPASCGELNATRDFFIKMKELPQTKLSRSKDIQDCTETESLYDLLFIIDSMKHI